jgi:hypothetical protein
MYTDGRVTARENEMRVLRALHRFGWLRTRDLAVLSFQPWSRKVTGLPNLAPSQSTASAQRMAQRTLRRMKVSRLVLSATGPDGCQMYALAEAGARVLQDISVPARTGKDQVRTFSFSHFRHRCISNEIAVSAISQGFRASTEREISRGRWIGGENGIAGKKPDVLLRNGGHWWWVEVEKSRRNAKDYAALIAWLCHVLRNATASPTIPIYSGVGMLKVVFICTPAFRTKLTKDLASHKWRESQILAAISFETSLYSFESINFS